MQKRDKHAGARGANRMADRDSAAIDVDASRIKADVLGDGKRLCRESFIGFNKV